MPRVDAWLWSKMMERLEEWRSLRDRIDDAGRTGSYEDETRLIKEQQEVADEAMLFLDEEIEDGE